MRRIHYKIYKNEYDAEGHRRNKVIDIEGDAWFHGFFAESDYGDSPANSTQAIMELDTGEVIAYTVSNYLDLRFLEPVNQ